jgi:WD40 repeat protein
MILRGHEGAVNSVAFRPDGERLASSGNDRTVRMWEVSDGAEPVVLGSHQALAGRLSFSPDGRLLASASEDGTVRVWRCEVCGPIAQVQSLANRRVTRELSPEEREVFLHR